MGALHKTTAVFLCDTLNFQKQVLHFCLFRVYMYESFFKAAIQQKSNPICFYNKPINKQNVKTERM